MYDSCDVANRFLDRSLADGRPLTPMQLLKLVYIAHGWMLGLYGRPLIRDDVQAWQYGPVIPRLYDHLRAYKGQPVDRTLPVSPGADELDETAIDLIDQVYEIYGHMTGMALSRITHAAGTPWEQTYAPGSFGRVIPSDLIADHYRMLMETRSDRAA